MQSETQSTHRGTQMKFTENEKAICLMLTQYITLYNLGFTNHAPDIVELSTQVQEMLIDKGLI
jgi:hypothetical protein